MSASGQDERNSSSRSTLLCEANVCDAKAVSSAPEYTNLSLQIKNALWGIAEAGCFERAEADCGDEALTIEALPRSEPGLIR